MKMLLCGCVVFTFALPSHADFTVKNSADSGPDSFRQAILDADALGGGTIRFTKVTGTIQLQSPLPALTQNITVIGPGNYQLIIQEARGSSLTNWAGNTVTIEGLTLIGGNYPYGAIANFGNLNLLNCKVTGYGNEFALGGGLSNLGNASLFNCTISDCSAGEGGAIWNSGSMNLEKCILTNSYVIFGHGGCIFNSGSLTLESSVIAKNGFSGGGSGGGIYNSGGTVVVKNCSITNNGAIYGGGIWNGGSLAIISSTLARNRAEYSSGPEPGGGLYNETNGVSMLVNTTISENDAMDQGGGVMNLGMLWLLNCTVVSNRVFADDHIVNEGGGIWNSGTVYSKNTIFAGNTATTFAGNLVTGLIGPDFFGVLVSQGFNLLQDSSDCTITGDTTGNLLGVDPLLGPLQSNGGPTLTHALLPGSPAMNAGTNDGAPSTDQRGVSRPQGPGTDIGSFEVLYHGKKPAK